MATTNVTYITPTIGIFWQRAVAWWAQHVVDDTKALSYTLTTLNTMRCVKMQYVQGADTFEEWHCLADLHQSAIWVPLQYVLPCAGFRAMPPLMSTVYGTRTTSTSFEAFLRQLREDILEIWCGHGAITWTSVDATGPLTGQSLKTYRAALRILQCTAEDRLVLNLKDGTMTQQFFGNAAPTDGILAGAMPPSVGAAGDGATRAQMDALVAATEQNAMQRFDVSLNHGQAIFSATTTTTIET